jgi:bifunctional non-homologous end joining protein LigD
MRGAKFGAYSQGKFPVVDFIKDPSGVAALYLGKKEGKDLVYIGKVGTGQIRKALDTVVSPKQKKTIRKPKATWVEPEFYADMEYRDVTSEGLCGQFVQGPEQRNAPFIAAFALQNRENERDG